MRDQTFKIAVPLLLALSACSSPDDTSGAPDLASDMSSVDMPRDLVTMPTLDMATDTRDLEVSPDLASPEDMSPDPGDLLEQDAPQDLGPQDMEAPPTHPGQHPDRWCERVHVGAASNPTSLSLPLQLSKAHAQVRFFGVHQGYASVDSALSTSLLNWRDPLSQPDLTRYANAFAGVCVVEAQPPRPLPSAEVTIQDGVLFLTPGATMPDPLPDGVEAVVLDWRDVPVHDAIEERLRASLQSVLTDDFQPASYNVRRHEGMVDEIFATGRNQNIYDRSTEMVTPEPIIGRAGQSLPLAIWTGVELTPRASRLAGSLRMQGKAALLGEAVSSSIAEASSAWVGGHAVVYRERDMFEGARLRWPDKIVEDAHVWTTEQVVDVWRTEGFDVEPRQVGIPFRARVEAIDYPDVLQPDRSLDHGVLRAGLITAHGAFDMFFVYFDEVGRQIDEELVELLRDVDAIMSPIPRSAYHLLLARALHHLHDAHCFVRDFDIDQTSYRAGKRYLAMTFEHVAGRPVVAWSDRPELQPGDELVSVNGELIQDFYARFRPLIAAASELRAEQLISQELLFQDELTVTFVVRDPQGVEREVSLPTLDTLTQAQIDAIYSLRFPRASGWLADLGAPDTYYINLDRSVTSTTQHIRSHYANLNVANRVILDMRGYPGTPSIWEFMGAIVGSPYPGPLFTQYNYTGAEGFVAVESQDTYAGSPTGVSFRGEVVLLVGPGTQSWAENMSMGLLTEGAAYIMGMPSSGTNGNITGLKLPGNFGVTFTGLHVRFSDGSPFHGIGITPDERVSQDAGQVASGEDTLLLQAIEHLQQSSP